MEKKRKGGPDDVCFDEAMWCRQTGCNESSSALQAVTVDESVREDERSNDEEKDENVESNICQLSNQRTASQRRDKSCAPSH